MSHVRPAAADFGLDSAVNLAAATVLVVAFRVQHAAAAFQHAVVAQAGKARTSAMAAKVVVARHVATPPQVADVADTLVADSSVGSTPAVVAVAVP